MKENLIFAWCKIWSLKFQFAEGIVWFFWIRKLWCFRNVKRSKGSCIRVGKASKIDIFQKMICWMYGHLWLVTSKDKFFSDLGQRQKDAAMIFFLLLQDAIGFDMVSVRKWKIQKVFYPPPPDAHSVVFYPNIFSKLNFQSNIEFWVWSELTVQGKNVGKKLANDLRGKKLFHFLISAKDGKL